MNKKIITISSLILLFALFLFIYKNQKVVEEPVEEPVVEETLPPESISLIEITPNRIYADEIFINTKITSESPITKVQLTLSEGETVLFQEESVGTEVQFTVPLTDEMRNMTNVTCTVYAEAEDGSTLEETTSVDLTALPPVIWPIKAQYKPLVHDAYLNDEGPPSVEGLTANNGKTREHHYIYLKPHRHKGIDITAESGTPVYAVADGTVSAAKFSSNDGTDSTGYGNVIYIEHADTQNGSSVETRYAHLSEMYVEPGQEVEQGELIGMSGNTGGSRIPHLHFECIVDGSNVHPLEVLPENGILEFTKEPVEGPGFPASSVALWHDIDQNGWQFTTTAITNKPITLGGNEIPVGTELNLVKRDGSTVYVNYNGQEYKVPATSLTYTY